MAFENRAEAGQMLAARCARTTAALLKEGRCPACEAQIAGVEMDVRRRPSAA